MVTLVRRHLAGVVALVLAVATGIALGAGPLSHQAWLPSAEEVQSAPAEPATGAGADEVARAAAPALYGSRLDGRTVALVSTPGVDEATLASLTRGIEAADGSVAARWSAGESLVGSGATTLVGTLGSQLLEQLDGRGADADAVGFERMGQLIGSAVAARDPAGAVPGPDALTIRQSLDAADLVTHDGGQPRRAPLVLLVLGDDLDDNVLAPLVAGIASRASGTVVTGPSTSPDLTVASEAGVTTVDGVEGDLGRLAAVLALARTEAEPGGSFGASGADGTLPLG